ncbi:MAG TPA: hypothetical protein VGB47_11110 [Thermoanaerobaculia bacterium]
MRTGERAHLRRTTAVSTAFALLLTCSPVAARTQAAAPPQSESPIEIAHDPLACMTPVLAPEVDAGVTPGQDYDRGYVYFRAAGTEDYYYARMEGPPTSLAAVLPRPLPETRAVDYFLRAYDLTQASKRKGDWTPPVVPGTTCKSKGVAVGPAGAGLTIGLTRDGQNPYPQGFNKKDIVKIILASGAIVTVAQALKAARTGGASGGGAGGGGISTGAAIAGGAALAAGAIAVAVAANDDENPTPTPTVTPTPTIPPLRFVQAEATWSGVGNVDVQLLSPAGQSVGQTFPSGCESTVSRTERVILQGVVAPGTYRVVLTGNSCGAGTPSAISAVVSVQADTGQKCASAFVSVPVGGTVTGCDFSVP